MNFLAFSFFFFSLYTHFNERKEAEKVKQKILLKDNYDIKRTMTMTMALLNRRVAYSSALSFFMVMQRFTAFATPNQAYQRHMLGLISQNS